ncbi:MAG: hypothetical protein GY850_22400, partial [bacterium]|nr:hypothetical protein [bacterium]
MNTLKTFLVWMGILCLTGLLLLGQESCEPVPPCIDLDKDGYGDPASIGCAYPELDCDDENHYANPGATEGPDGDFTCDDAFDNDCDGLFNMDDPECVPCTDEDGDGYGNPGGVNCEYLETDCDDLNYDVNPNAVEGPLGSETCSDADLDNDCDGFINEADSDCIPCQDIDGDGYGVLETVNCDYQGLDCDDNNFDINPGVDEAGHETSLCSDGLDNDCDNLIDSQEMNCYLEPFMLSIPAVSGFMMGDSSDGCLISEDECPSHPVNLSAFDIDASEVINKEYRKCVDAGQCTV